MRGTFCSTHSWSVRRHAAISGSAEFLFPSTDTFPASRRPPSTVSDAISRLSLRESEPHDFFPQRHTKLRRHFALAPVNEPNDVGSAGSPFVHDEVRVRRRDTRLPFLCTLQAG